MSGTRLRIAMMKRYIRLFGKDNIHCVLGDREFIGCDWFEYLNFQQIAFFIRVKNNADTYNSRGLSVTVDGLFHDLAAGERRQLKGLRLLYGNQLTIWGARSPETGELMIVVTNAPKEDAISHYLQRWKIETLFGHLKSKGFNMEQTHMQQRYKLKKMVAILTIAYAWSVKVGEVKHRTVKTIPLKKHGRKAKSIFRYGLDEIQIAIKTLWQNKISHLKKLIRIFLEPSKNKESQPIQTKYLRYIVY